MCGVCPCHRFHAFCPSGQRIHRLRGFSDAGHPVLSDECYGRTAKERGIPVCCPGTFEQGAQSMAAGADSCPALLLLQYAGHK